MKTYHRHKWQNDNKEHTEKDTTNKNTCTRTKQNKQQTIIQVWWLVRWAIVGKSRTNHDESIHKKNNAVVPDANKFENNDTNWTKSLHTDTANNSMCKCDHRINTKSIVSNKFAKQSCSCIQIHRINYQFKTRWEGTWNTWIIVV